MATNTYVALDKVTISGTSTSTVSFTSIPSTYTDLIIVGNLGSETTNAFAYLQFNGDTGSNYSNTELLGNGSTASSSRGSNLTQLFNSNVSVKQGAINSTVMYQIMNYSNTTINKTALARQGTNNAADYNGTNVQSGLWRSTAAINRVDIKLTRGGTGYNFSNGSTFSLYGITKEPMLSTKATGGAIAYGSDGYIYHLFTSSGTFAPNQSLSCQVLVVGGGGGGESFYSGVGWGSGGTGGYVTYSGSSSFTAQNYTVTIGAGGAGGTGTSGANGSTGGTSSVNSITAAGGAGGTDGSGPGYGAGGTVSTYRSSPAGAIGVEYFGYKVAGGGWYGQNSQDIANYPVNSTQYGGGFQKGYTVASASTLPYYGGGGAGGSNSGEGGTSAGQSGASGLVIIRYLA